MAACWVPTLGTAVSRLRRASQEAPALGFGLLQGAAAALHAGEAAMWEETSHHVGGYILPSSSGEPGLNWSDQDIRSGSAGSFTGKPQR